jgi:hypothetical protein
VGCIGVCLAHEEMLVMPWLMLSPPGALVPALRAQVISYAYKNDN